MIHEETNASLIGTGPIDQFRLFVYGTLKRGYWNHEHFCRNVAFIEKATVYGRLYELPSAIPVLDIPKENILAVGSEHVLADLRIQNKLTEDSSAISESWSSDKWVAIKGEVITLSEPEYDLPPIDRLEGFRPGMSSLYRRVLVLIRTESGCIMPAWTFALGVAPERCVLNLLQGGNEWNPETR